MIHSAPTQLWLVRHGQTDWNRAERIQGQLDIPLNAQGHDQARRIAQRMADQPLTRIYASSLLRARQTALALAQPHGLTPEVMPELGERHHGVFQGMTPAEQQAHDPELYAAMRARLPDACPPQGESLRMVSDRVRQALATLQSRHPGERILVVTHGGILDVIYRITQGIGLEAPRTWGIPNTGLSALQARGPDDWALTLWADTQHLATASTESGADFR